MSERETIAEKQLHSLVQRRKLPSVAKEHRVNVRGFAKYFEVHERFGGADPKSYTDLTRWFKGENDLPGKPCGSQFWLDLCRRCGQDPRPYDQIPHDDFMKLTIEHYFSQYMSGDWSMMKHGLMNLFALEAGYNNSAEFKEMDSLAQMAFFGTKTHRNHVAFVNWAMQPKHRNLPSLAFMQSSVCQDSDLIYASSGLRATGFMRQLYLPFGAAAGLRSGVKRARVEEVSDEDTTIEMQNGQLKSIKTAYEARIHTLELENKQLKSLKTTQDSCGIVFRATVRESHEVFRATVRESHEVLPASPRMGGKSSAKQKLKKVREESRQKSPPQAFAAAGVYQFDANAPPEERWAIVARTIRERGESGFFDQKCWGLATDEMTCSDTQTSLEQWLIKAFHALKHIGAPLELPNRSESDPLAELLKTWLGNGSDQQNLTKALNLQAHCLVSTPEEQMRSEQASNIELELNGSSSIHHKVLGKNMLLVLYFGNELRVGRGFSHVRDVFDDVNGIVNDPNIELVNIANRQQLNEMTASDNEKLRRLRVIAKQLKVSGNMNTIIQILRNIGAAIGLKLLEPKVQNLRQPVGPRKRFVSEDPGLRFERVLPEVVDRWLVWSQERNTKVSVANFSG